MLNATLARRLRERLIDEAVRNVAKRWPYLNAVEQYLDVTERSLKSPDIGRPTLDAIRAEFCRLSAA